MRKTIKIKRVQSSQWYDRECVEKKKDARKAVWSYRKTNQGEDKQLYFVPRKEYKALPKTKQKQFKQDRVNQLESSVNDPRDFGSKNHEQFNAVAQRPSTITFLRKAVAVLFVNVKIRN